MSDSLYHDAILQAARRASGAGRLDPPCTTVTLDNPLCGDRITLDLRLADGKVAALAHKVRGCLLCQAAASVIGAAAPGRSAAELHRAAASVRALLVGEGAGDWAEFAVFLPVRDHKSRHDCVLLPFEALEEALAQAESPGKRRLDASPPRS